MHRIESSLSAGSPRARRTPRTARAGLLAALFALAGCSEQPAEPPAPRSSAAELETAGVNRWEGPFETGAYPSEIAVSWFDLSYDLVRAERWSPPVASRFWGYAGVSLYEAVRPGIEGATSLAGQLNGLAQGSLPRTRGRGYHWPAAANEALHVVFLGLFETASQPTRDLIEAHYAERADLYEQSLPRGVFLNSESYGRALGQAVLAWASADGFAAINNCPYVPPVGEGMWVPTPPAYAPALQPCWGSLRTCVVDGGVICDPGMPPPYSEEPGSAFYDEAREVYLTSLKLTSEQREIALFWADNPGQTGTPPGHWISLLGQLLAEDGAPLDLAAGAYARTGLAVMDAFVCCWYTKYQVNLLRPVTYIREVFDPAWSSFVTTPPFPEYTSGHSTQSGAVAEVLTEIFGDRAFTDHTHDELGMAPRSFSGFWEAAEEAAVSRLYGGIHFRSAIENGIAQGRCIGEQVNALALEPPGGPAVAMK